MKLRLPLNRSLGPALVALAAGLTGEAAEQLAGVSADPVEAVHRARVALKRARSVLRLLEKAGAAWALLPRYRLAELGSRMSAEREAAVAADLAADAAHRVRGPEAAVLRLLAARAGRRVPRSPEGIRQALRQESRLLAVAPPPVITPAQLRGLLRRSLDRVARRHYAAARKPTPEAVHEWRKAVIILRDQATLAAARWPQGAGLAQPLLVRLARQLGRRGDRALLVRRLKTLRVPPAFARSRRALLARHEARLAEETLAVLLSWLTLERRLTRLLAQKKNPAQ